MKVSINHFFCKKMLVHLVIINVKKKIFIVAFIALDYCLNTACCGSQIVHIRKIWLKTIVFERFMAFGSFKTWLLSIKPLKLSSWDPSWGLLLTTYNSRKNLDLNLEIQRKVVIFQKHTILGYDCALIFVN